MRQARQIAYANSMVSRLMAIAGMTGSISSVFKPIFTLIMEDIRDTYTLWQFVLTCAGALVTIAGWFASASTLLYAQLSLLAFKTADIVVDAIDVDKKCP